MPKIKEILKEIQKVEQNNIANIKWEMMYEKTPKDYIKTFQGRGGKQLAYVETGYMVKKLNQVFNYLWDFEVVSEKVEQGHIIVKGKLTAHMSPELTLTKTQYGGASIKSKQDGNAVDIADDMKAAASDALKKCASMFGIASDIYWGGEVEEEKEDVQPLAQIDPIAPPVNIDKITVPQQSKIRALYMQKGLNSEAMKLVLIKRYDIDSHAKLTKKQASDYIEYLLNIDDKANEFADLDIE